MPDLTNRLIKLVHLVSCAVLCATTAESLSWVSPDEAMVYETLFHEHMRNAASEIQKLQFEHPALISFAGETKTKKE